LVADSLGSRIYDINIDFDINNNSNNNNNNNNNHYDIYSAVIMTRSLREFTRFIW